APVAYGWRLWRMVSACGVWLAPVACRVRIVWTVYSVRLSCLCVVPMCRHGCAYMPTWLRGYGVWLSARPTVYRVWIQGVRLWRVVACGYGVLYGMAMAYGSVWMA